MITLYHGSNVGIDLICLDKCSPFKDFGRGFYLADIEEQAWQMAVRRTRIAGEGEPLSLRNGGCKSSSYEIYTLYYTQEYKADCTEIKSNVLQD